MGDIDLFGSGNGSANMLCISIDNCVTMKNKNPNTKSTIQPIVCIL